MNGLFYRKYSAQSSICQIENPGQSVFFIARPADRPDGPGVQAPLVPVVAFASRPLMSVSGVMLFCIFCEPGQLGSEATVAAQLRGRRSPRRTATGPAVMHSARGVFWAFCLILARRPYTSAKLRLRIAATRGRSLFSRTGRLRVRRIWSSVRKTRSPRNGDPTGRPTAS